MQKMVSPVHTLALDMIRSHAFAKKRCATSWLQSDVTSKRLFFDLLDIGYNYGVDYFLTEFDVGRMRHNSLYIFDGCSYVRVGSSSMDHMPSPDGQLPCAVLIHIDSNIWIGNHEEVGKVTQFCMLNDTHILPDVCVWLDMVSMV